jgi:hypothetical protein
LFVFGDSFFDSPSGRGGERRAAELEIQQESPRKFRALSPRECAARRAHLLI